MKPKTTPWYSYRTPPAQKGLYECRFCGELHLWDMLHWHVNGTKIDPKTIQQSSPLEWRGLAEKVK